MWVARNKDCSVFLHTAKPVKSQFLEIWVSNSENCNYSTRLYDTDLDDELRSVSWNDAEPREVILTAKKL